MAKLKTEFTLSPQEVFLCCTENNEIARGLKLTWEGVDISTCCTGVIIHAQLLVGLINEGRNKD